MADSVKKVTYPNTTQHRPFNMPVVAPMNYADGMGPDEIQGAHRNTTPDPWDPYCGAGKKKVVSKDPNGIY